LKENEMKKTVAAVLATLVAALALAGCNTMAGVGKDIEKGGEAIQGAAKK
jgi:predicted small secreted protein